MAGHRVAGRLGRLATREELVDEPRQDAGPTAEGGQKPSTTYKAFAGLDELLKDKK